MQALVSVSGGDEAAELVSLYEWVRGERSLAGVVRLVRRPPGEGELGSWFELLAVALNITADQALEMLERVTRTQGIQ